MRDEPWLLNPRRLLCALAMLVIPATAMGATLPLMVAKLFRHDPHFGRVLGRLYGWNTAGAVLGALAGDLLILPALLLVAFEGKTRKNERKESERQSPNHRL